MASNPETTRRVMAERDFRLMERDTSTPLESGRVTALADRCEIEGLDNCAATLRGLLAEVEWLHGRMDGMITEVSRWSIKASEEMEAIYHAGQS